MNSRITKITDFLFNPEVASGSRLPWVDYAKGLAIILVAYRHILIGFDRSGLPIHPTLMDANEIFFSFRMPLFFILSGVFISRSLLKRGTKGLIINKWKTLLFPYLIWASIQISLQIIFSKYTNASRSWIDYTFILLSPDKLDQMWYLLALFNVAFLYILFKSLFKLGQWQQLLLGVIFHSLSLYLNFGPWHDILYYYLFYVLGDIVSPYLLDRSRYKLYGSWKVFFILLPLFVLCQWYFIHHESIQFTKIYLFAFIALSGCAFMLNICFKLQQWGGMFFLKIVGYYSLYVYVLHVMIVSFLRSFFVDFIGVKSVPVLLFINLTLGISISIVLFNLMVRMGLGFLFTLDKRRIPAFHKDASPRAGSLISNRRPTFENETITNK